MLKPDTLLKNRYYIKRVIGQGGMGAVYEALDRQTKQTVAVKQAFFSGDKRLEKAFRREAHILEQLRHSSLPVVIEFFADGESQYLVMQFIPGDDLGMQLKAHDEPFDLVTVLHWTDQLLSVLDYLHNQLPPVIHRDIKPQNVKLTQTGDIILLDFGLAKGMAVQDGSTSTFKTIMGYTPNFASLEQRRGQVTDARSDLYSLGATVYQLLTNTVPDDAMERAAAMGVLEVDLLRPINEVNPIIPYGVAELLMQSLELRPEKRPASAAAMRAALWQVWESSQLQARARTVVDTEVGRDTSQVAEPTRRNYQDIGTARNESPEALPIQNPTYYATRRMPAMQAEAKAGSALPGPLPTAVDKRSQTTRRSPYKLWSVILGFGFVAVIAGGYLLSTSPRQVATINGPAVSSSSPSPGNPSQSGAARSEYLRYSIEAETKSGKSVSNGLDGLSTGRFKFHFRSQVQGFLYIVTLDKSGKLTAFLTDIASEATGVKSNSLTPNSDFPFPVSGWIHISKATGPVNYTVIFSSSPVKDLGFLHDQPFRPLTADEQSALKSFQGRYSTSGAETKREGEFAAITALSGRTEPLIFDIEVNPR